MKTAEQILNKAINYFGIPPLDMKGKISNRPIVEARACYVYASRVYSSESTTEIGRKINKDHSTVTHYTSLVRDLPDVGRKYREFERHLFKK